ncbi:FABP family protein, partial [Dietzia sp. Cai40]|nr:FABP family protein [Dietzia sp. Cai40]
MTDGGHTGAVDPTSSTPEGGDGGSVVRGSANAAVDAAAQRSEQTAGRNIPAFSDLPVPGDTANLRFGP